MDMTAFPNPTLPKLRRCSIGWVTSLIAMVWCSPAFAQPFGFEVSVDPEGMLQFTNISDADIPLSQFELNSSMGFLIPIPPGDLTADPDPFTFLLANDSNRIIYSNLRINDTISVGDTWTTRLGYDLDAARGAGDRLTAEYQDIDQSLTVQGICGLTAVPCPEPSAVWLGTGGLLFAVYLRRRRVDSGVSERLVG